MTARNLIHRLGRLMARFRDDTRGSLTAEAVIVLPLMIWAAVAMVAYWDVYRTINRLQSANSAVLDMVLRQETVSSTAYIPNIDNVVEYFLDEGTTPRVRVTVVCFNASANQYRVVWSRSPGNLIPQLTTSTLQPLADKLPVMAAGRRMVVMESEVNYVPTINLGINDIIGVGPQTIREFTVAETRNQSGRLLLTGTPDPNTCA